MLTTAAPKRRERFISQSAVAGARPHGLTNVQPDDLSRTPHQPSLFPATPADMSIVYSRS